MAVATIVSLLETLREAISSATTAFPSDQQSLLPPEDGISLLDLKNDLLLSYLQNLVFLIILRLKTAQSSNDAAEIAKINEDVVRKLVELKVFMERGVRPLESKLQYQIHKSLRAAQDADMTTRRNTTVTKVKKAKKSRRSVADGSDISDDASHSGEDSDAESDEEEDRDEDLIHRPNITAMIQQDRNSKTRDTKTASRSKSQSGGDNTKSGAYKPPRITPTAMPTSSSNDRNGDNPSRRRKQHLVDEYIDEEMSTMPRAQPSIGSNSTILAHGRSSMSTRDREKEKERLDYEERNFVRLPAESKAERRKSKARNMRDARDMFGGEDWTGLGGLGDRINKSVAGKGGVSVLERREKRKRATEDGPRGSGVGGGDGAMGIGEAFDRRRKVLQDRADKKRRRNG